MGLIFADTSALLKRHISERGSAWVRGWIGQEHRNTIVIAEIAIPETISALARLRRQAFLSAQSFARLRESFEFAATEEYMVIPIAEPILQLTSELVVRHPLLTLDAIHLASARIAAQRFSSYPTFITADRRLLAAAAAEGFPTDDPNSH